MEKDPQCHDMWFLITIDDAPKFLSGKSIYDLMQLILSVNSYKHIIVNGLEGPGTYDLSLNEGNILKTDFVMKKLRSIQNLEWGDFFLFKNSPIDWSSEQIIEYPAFIAKTDTTVRAVDNQYMYIYTTDKNLVERIGENYTIESIKVNSLDKLDYPY